jgi:glycosyltransferase involved in cell wall biosynthesis
VRILVIANDFPEDQRPQAGIFVRRQAEEFGKQGWCVRVARFVPWAPPIGRRWQVYRQVPAAYQCGGLSVTVMRVLLLPRFWLGNTLHRQTQRRIERLIEEFRPDVMHAHQIFPTSCIAVGHQIPVVITAHGRDAYDYPFRNHLFRRVAQQAVSEADWVVAVSGFIAEKARELGARRVSVVYNGADPTVFYPMERARVRRDLGIAEDTRVVLFAGHLSRRKGLLDLTRAVRMLDKMNLLLLVAGDGPERGLVMRELDSAQVQARFVGVVEQSYLARLLAAADVLALPSYEEGLPAVICEAMLSERAVIASQVGGIPEIVRHGETGFLISPGDVRGLAEGLHCLLKERQLNENLSHAAYRFATAHLTWSSNACAYQRIFQEVIEHSNRDRRRYLNVAHT